jgi:hypothetical protein
LDEVPDRKELDMSDSSVPVGFDAPDWADRLVRQVWIFLHAQPHGATMLELDESGLFEDGWYVFGIAAGRVAGVIRDGGPNVERRGHVYYAVGE